jgi:recombination DNA repair RAD52 pathway protein
MSGFNAAQVAQLLKPIRRERVLQDGKGHAHVSQQDVVAHLIRVFGFGAFDTDIRSLDVVFERERRSDKGEPLNRWDVCYRAVVRLTIRDEAGTEVCHFEDGSTAVAQNQTLGDGHDLAMKSALSLAKKRCAIHLGDQFGLSLYSRGQTSPLVIDTLVKPGESSAATDVQEGVPQQHDEVIA